jgi:hypothetical protein
MDKNEKTFYISRVVTPRLFKSNKELAKDDALFKEDWNLLMKFTKEVLDKHPSTRFRININTAILNFNIEDAHNRLTEYCKYLIEDKPKMILIGSESSAEGSIAIGFTAGINNNKK